jgi:hypothetical protein
MNKAARRPTRSDAPMPKMLDGHGGKALRARLSRPMGSPHSRVAVVALCQHMCGVHRAVSHVSSLQILSLQHLAARSRF